MLSKRSKISISILSICILAFLTTSTLAAKYDHHYHLTGCRNYPGLPNECRLTVALEVTTGIGAGGGPIITSKSGSWSWWTVYHYTFPFWLWWWKFSSNIEWSYEYNEYDEKISVKYRVWGRVWDSRDYDIKAYISVWVKIYAGGQKTQGTSVWDDNTGLIWLDHS
ncbi:MAG: hypothetical protein ACFE9N_00470 [Promethearchaeota archaeon]